MRPARWLVLCCFSAISRLAVPAATYYVSPSGSDSSPGTLDQPFATLQFAVDRLASGDVLLVRAGQYRGAVKVQRSGTAGAPITIRAYPGECPLLIGAALVPGAWERHQGSAYSAPWPEQPLQVFAGGRLLVEARWPNTRIEDFQGMTYALADAGSQDWITSARLPDLDLTGAWAHIMAGQSWVVYSRQIAVHDRAAGRLSWTKPVNAIKELIPMRGNHFFLFGKREFLDAPGEWWWDPAARRLHVWMPDGGSPEGRVEAGTAGAVLDLSGRSYVVVEGLSSRGGWFNLQDSVSCTVRDCHLRAPNWIRTVDGYNVWPQFIGGVDVSGSGNLVKGGSVRLAGHSGVRVGGTGNTVRHVTVEDSGWTWVNQAGIMASESDQAVIENNTIRRSAMAGIVMGPRIRVRANLVEDVCLFVEDCGNVNAWSKDGQGAEVAYNLLRGNRSRWGAAIYLDALCRNFILHDNVAENIEWSGTNITGPTIVENNTFLDVQHYGINFIPTGTLTDWSAGRAANNLTGQPFPMIVMLAQPERLIKGWAHYFTHTTLAPSPRRVEILWAQLAQPAWSADHVPLDLSEVNAIVFGLEAPAEPFRYQISNLRLLALDGTEVPVSGAATWSMSCERSTNCALTITGLSAWELSGSTPIGGQNLLTAALPAELKDLTRYRGLAFELSGSASRNHGFQGFQDVNNGPTPALGRGATLPAVVGADASRAWPVCVSAAAQVGAGGVVNGASFAHALAPGCLASVFGTGLADGTYSNLYLPGRRAFPSSAAGVSVNVNGNPAPLIYVSPQQINFQIPWGTTSPATVQVTREGAASNGEPVSLTESAPSVFQAGDAAIVSCVGGVVHEGAACTLWGNGFGRRKGVMRNGEPAGATPFLPAELETSAACSLSVGGKAAPVTYCGAAPGLIIDQLNFVYPGGVAGGSPAEAVLTVGGVSGTFRVPAPAQ